jgi:hypothetical protein
MWQEAFSKLVTSKGYDFTICLENLNFYWNPDIRNIQQLTLFIRWLYIEALIKQDKKDEIVTVILKSLLPSIYNNQHFASFKQFLFFIGKEFQLLILEKEDLVKKIARILSISIVDDIFKDLNFEN